MTESEIDRAIEQALKNFDISKAQIKCSEHYIMIERNNFHYVCALFFIAGMGFLSAVIAIAESLVK